MFKTLQEIQESMFGPTGESLIYTLKNIGICYLALGENEKAEDYYNKAMAIIEKHMAERKTTSSRYKEVHKEDLEQMAAIYFNLYLCSM